MQNEKIFFLFEPQDLLNL